VVSDDPIFGLFAYGGDLKKEGNTISVVPKMDCELAFMWCVTPHACNWNWKGMDRERPRDSFR